MDNETWARLRTLLGTPCLRYLLACEAQEQPDPDAPGDLTAGQLEALSMLDALLPAEVAERVGIQREWLIEQQLTMSPDGQEYPSTAIRRSAGGAVAGLTADDPLTDLVLRLFDDAYPFLLIPREHAAFGAKLPSCFYKHPAEQRFAELIVEDPDLSRLFPEENAHTGKGGAYVGPGRGGSLQLWGFAAHLVVKAWEFAQLDVEVPTPHDVAAKIPGVVDSVRRAASGETVKVPARVGLAGILLPDGCDAVEGKGFRIRRADARDQRLIAGTTLEGQASGEGPDGEAVLLDYAGNLVLETTMTYRIKLGPLSPEMSWPANLTALRTEWETLIEDVRLAVALTSAVGSPTIIVVPSWTLTADLLGQGPGLEWANTRQDFRLEPRRLTQAEVVDWGEWLERVRTTKGRERLEVAIRRLLQARGSQRSIDDIFIDAVMVWENLFGGAGETTLRITTSLAWLLAKDYESRKALAKELKDIYTLRSRIVHGAKQTSPSDVPLANRAVQIAADALRVLYTQRPELMGEHDGTARSNRIMLGG
ncbi:hypothetical protein ACI2LF_31980 [Kribbella sp. NPDC020789]